MLICKQRICRSLRRRFFKLTAQTLRFLDNGILNGTELFLLGQRIVMSGFALIVALQRIAQVIPDGIIRSNLRQLFLLIHDFIDLNRPYRSNEILTACLNLSGKNLADYLQELNELRQKVQLEEGGGYDFCERYDRNVQRAQKLFFQIADTVKKVPPYKNISSLRTVLDGQLKS